MLFQQYGRYQLRLLLSDTFLIAISLGLTLLVSNLIRSEPIAWSDEKVYVVYGVLWGICLLVFFVMGLYDAVHMRRPETLVLAIFFALGIVIIIFSSIAFFVPYLRIGKRTLLTFIFFSCALTFGWRLYCKSTLLLEPQNLFLVGNDRIINELTKIIQEEYSHYYNIVEDWKLESADHSPLDLINSAQGNSHNVIVYSVKSQIVKKVAPSLLNLRFKNIFVYDAPTFYQRLTGKLPIWHLDDFWMLINSQKEAFFPSLTANIKRVFDLAFAVFFLPLALPVLLVCAVAIKLTSRGPVFFVQERLGQNELPFRLVKFRTMVKDAEKLSGPRWSSENDPRITRVGRILRKLRLDELPQIFHLFSGKMSVIGPRPIRKHFADLLAAEIPYYRLRFLVKPGLTGWAQVNHDYGGSIEGQAQKLQYELFYLVNQSFWLDLFILLKTIKIMVWGKGV
jgi:exopolysaccharide biosynthesis polyprenyl glycosylphosphotransferase